MLLKAEKVLTKAKLPSLRALVHVWNKKGKSAEAVTEELFRTRRYEHLQVTTHVVRLRRRTAVTWRN